MKKKLLKLSLITGIIAVCLFVVTFLVFHFVTDEGITFVWHEEAGKPLITDMIAMLSVLFFFASLFSLLLAFVVFNEPKNKE